MTFPLRRLASAAFQGVLRGLCVLLLSGCDGGIPAPPTPTTGPPPSPAPTSTPTPLFTPLPPVSLSVRFPQTVSALEGVTVTVELPGLAERDPQARVWAQVFPPDAQEPFWESPLEPIGNGKYVSSRPLHLPLKSIPGEWRLLIDVHTAAAVEGNRRFPFRQEPIPFWDLNGQVPEEVTLLVPQEFLLTRQEGDRVAGVRIWRRGEERVELWWAPGPAEPLTQDTAQMLVEATFPVMGTVEILSAEAVIRGKRPGFRFQEQWPEGPAEALVVQGSSRYLYLLRVGVSGRPALTHLLQEIQAALSVR
ncbi:MAG: hypothetical protein RML46_03615 [Anaerolineae bacterium]|nr:hypothetical protein [Anaerolineae bacterium]MDW8067979.1 hypothetical protein [Anaerolineae bacterium]